MRFHSAPVICVADAKPVQLGHMFKADGRWRLVAFAGEEANGKDIKALCAFLTNSPQSPIQKFTPDGADSDAVIDFRAVFQQAHRTLDIHTMHPLLTPQKGRYNLKDHEKVFAPDLKSGNDIFRMRGLDRAKGCIVILRPDQYVAQILPIDAFEQLSNFFGGFMRAPD